VGAKNTIFFYGLFVGGKGKAEISGRAGYHSHVLIYVYMYSKILTNILFKYDTVTFGFLSGRE
jgi:hypothetical protein